MGELKVSASGPGQLALGGALIIQNASTIFRKIRDFLEQTDHLVVTVAEDAEVDVSFLQILCAAHRTAAGQNKCFRLKTQKTRAFESAARAAGYIRVKGCQRDRDGSCLWARGKR